MYIEEFSHCVGSPPLMSNVKKCVLMQKQVLGKCHKIIYKMINEQEPMTKYVIIL